jgi:peptidoglycan/LPS O-acetylase OafA/YrhL
VDPRADSGMIARDRSILRLSFLDSVRGIAAFVVLLDHVHRSVPEYTWAMDLQILRFLKASVLAVSMFFVLSGFVLYLQLEARKIGYIQFLVRRAFRLFPCLIVSVLISYLIYILWHPWPASSSQFLSITWPSGLTLETLVSDSVLNSSRLLNPAWSLIVEWRISLVFPALFFLLGRSTPLTCAIAILSTYLAAQSDVSYGRPSISFFYVSFFVSGMLIAKHRLEIILFLRSKIWLRISLALLSAYYIFFRSESDSASGYLLQGFLASVILALCLSTSQVRRALRSPITQYLGRISFPLYLIHIIWVGVWFRLLEGPAALLAIPLTIGASILSADILHRLVEVPANKLGIRLATRALKRADASRLAGSLSRGRSTHGYRTDAISEEPIDLV